MDRREVVRIVRVCHRTVYGLFYSGNVYGANAFGDRLPIFGALFSVLAPAMEDEVFGVGRGQFDEFCRLTARMAFAVFQFQFRSPADSGSFYVRSLLPIAVARWQVHGVTCAYVVRSTYR